MGHKTVMLAGAFFALAVAQAGYAQQPGNVHRIAYLQGSPNFDTARVKASRRRPVLRPWPGRAFVPPAGKAPGSSSS